MVQQAVYGIMNDHNSLSVNIVNQFECKDYDFHGWIDSVHG